MAEHPTQGKTGTDGQREAQAEQERLAAQQDQVKAGEALPKKLVQHSGKKIL